MARFFPSPIEAFARAFDELFDELLVGPWRAAAGGIRSEQAMVLDRGDRYEVRVLTGSAEPKDLVVEVSEQRLTVSEPGGRLLEHTFTFPEPVDATRVSSRWSEGSLLVVLPKKRRARKTRRIEIEKH